MTGRWVYPALVLVTLAAYWGVWRHQFVAWDDNYNLYENPRVREGLTLKNAAWAVGSMEGGNWFPMTWISWMALRTDSRMQHLFNLALHAANACLVFLLLSLICHPERSEGSAFALAPFFAAAIFALHPLRAESVAWVSGRTDLLMAFFALLAALQYVRGRYNLSVLLFALAVFSKSSAAAPLPFAMFFLIWIWHRGVWLERRDRNVFLPLGLLAAGGALLQAMARHYHGAVQSLQMIPASQRIGNMLAAYASYLGKSIWPVNLSPAYPLLRVDWKMAAAAGLLLAAVTMAAIRRAARGDCKWLLGWLWFLLMLGPFAGLVQATEETIADRYLYLPLLGLIVPVAIYFPTEIAEFTEKNKGLIVLTNTAFLCVLCGGLVLATHRQMNYWHDSRALFTRAVAVTRDNYKMHNQLGYLASREGRHEEAMAEFRESLRIAPGYQLAAGNLLFESKREKP